MPNVPSLIATGDLLPFGPGLAKRSYGVAPHPIPSLSSSCGEVHWTNGLVLIARAGLHRSEQACYPSQRGSWYAKTQAKRPWRAG